MADWYSTLLPFQGPAFPDSNCCFLFCCPFNRDLQGSSFHGIKPVQGSLAGEDNILVPSASSQKE